MRRARIELSLPVPNWLRRTLGPVRRRWATRRQPPDLVPNLLGDRSVEWAWIASEMPSGPGRALDLGSADTNLPLIAAGRGFEVVAVDLRPSGPPYLHSAIRYVQGDILELPLAEGSFDLVTNCSTVEHIGLAGRYGVEVGQNDGDLAAMARLRRLLKLEGQMLLTIPVGRDALRGPYFRVYGPERLPRLLEGFETISEAYWAKDGDNRWRETGKHTALSIEAEGRSGSPRQCYYALGCMTLRPLPSS